MSDNDKQIDFSASLFGNGDVPQALQPNPSVEIFKSITKEIYSTKNLELKTELNDTQIIAFSQARAFSKKYKVPLLAEFVKNISLYSISKSRKGRKEFEAISKANLQMAGSVEERETPSIPARLLGNR